MADRSAVIGTVIAALIAAAAGITIALINRAPVHSSTPPAQSATSLGAQPREQSSTTVKVDANGWTHTGVMVHSGQLMLINATGTWTTWGEHLDIRPLVGPAGYAGDWDREIVEGHSQWRYDDFKKALPVPSAPSGALIGKIGADKFLVGPSTQRLAAQDGELLLGCNDIDENNLGTMTVDISVK